MNSWKKRLGCAFLTMLLSGMVVEAAPSTPVRGQLVQFHRPVEVEAGETVAGDVVSFFSTVTIRGQVEGDVVGVFSQITVEGGTIEGDTVAVFAPLYLQRATVEGDAISVFGGVTADAQTSISGSAVGVMGSGLNARDARVQGDRIDVAGFLPGNMSGLPVLAVLLAIFLGLKQLVAFVVGVIAIVVFPERFERMADHGFDEVGKKTLVGILLSMGVLVLMVILAVSVVGSPLVPLVFPAFMLLEFAGNTTMKIALGRRIGQGLGRQWGAILELFIGSLIYLLLEITLVGKIFTFIFKLIGMGEVMDSRFGDRPKHRQAGGLADAPSN
ncbi:hypothetical protein [Anoxynatronum buryatiense]|uniref:Polymer-forming cytoskeletal protein n=1 Tax=Anoxynatronum buryatiense TaxID=489973 RepID=A0AA45WY89_9CLOT|nr:hypothetical protein [Anoxynatronum buryatiense]SMP67240.1 hypothetical protein SAMN06296020_11526 [Anoxynatronum buryatiense]